MNCKHCGAEAAANVESRSEPGTASIANKHGMTTTRVHCGACDLSTYWYLLTSSALKAWEARP